MVFFICTRKRIALLLLVLSVISVVFVIFHLSFNNNSNQYFANYYWSLGDSSTSIPYAKRPRIVWKSELWEPVNSLKGLKPYANPRGRGSYPAPKAKNNGFIYAKVFGGFANIKTSICDLVAISRLLNASLVIPKIQESTRAKHISHKFKSFSYLYNEDEFMASLSNDVIIVKNLPEILRSARKKKKFLTFKPKRFANPDFYINEVLPKLKKTKVIGLVITDGGCLQSILPPNMFEIQRLRCRVAYHALQFRPEIQMLGHHMLERLHSRGQPFIAYHPGLTREALAYHGCAELFQDLHTKLIQYRRAQMIKQGVVSDQLNVDSHLRRDNGSCPLMPEEVGLLLRAIGYPAKTILYIAGSETFGGQRVLIPLRAMFENSKDCTTLCTRNELSNLMGPEIPIPSNMYKLSPIKNKEQLKEEWDNAGPRPRPLPPPPDRPIYQHEKEGWYGWITENDTEPDPSPMDLRQKAHRLLRDALDYIVSVEADAFFPGFHNDGSGLPDFSNLVMGHRLYESAASRTYRPDRKIVQEFLSNTRDNLYHPSHSWKLKMKDHLTKSLSESGLMRQSLLSKPSSFLSHPLPECSCRIPSEDSDKLKDQGEDKCPEWMLNEPHNDIVEVVNNIDEEPENDRSDLLETQELPVNFNEDDDEWDPND